MPPEDNPAMGWRAIRMVLDRPTLLRGQLRALLRAASGRHLQVMFPMVAEVAELVAARRLLDMEIERARAAGFELPARIEVGTMVEVPSLYWQLKALLARVDFVSIGSNDLFQFLFACDRGNPALIDRYDVLSPAALSFLHELVQRCRAAGVRLAVCGEMASRPLEAMALIGLGIASPVADAKRDRAGQGHAAQHRCRPAGPVSARPARPARSQPARPAALLCSGPWRGVARKRL